MSAFSQEVGAGAGIIRWGVYYICVYEQHDDGIICEVRGAGHGHTVLVVEDELMVRLPIAEYLRDCGYSVFEAGNAAEAIDVINGVGSVSVVFSDVRMPGQMDGFGLAQWCEAHHPGIPVLLTSGYNPNRMKMANNGAAQLITKPYTQAQVAGRIAAVLSR